MEIRARYTLIGAFTLAVILMIFAFVYWMQNSGGLGERRGMRIIFGNTVSGLLNGSPVFFNGLRVGEVTALRFRADNPGQLEATLAIDPATPIRTDTRVGLDLQGLTGVAVITLSGGSPSAEPLTAQAGQIPVLTAPANAGESLTQAAQTALQRVNTVLSESAAPLYGTLENLRTFSDALARNSDRVDGVMAGLERMTGGAGKAKGPTYDLTPPRDVQGVKVPEKQLAIPEVTAATMFDNDKIVRKTAAENTTIDGGQWSDALPRLVQLRLIQSFENAGYAGSIGKAGDGLTPDFQLVIDMRSFQLSVTPDPVGEVEFGAKILGSEGKIIAGRLFQAKSPAKNADAPGATAAINDAFMQAATELVLWASEVLANPS